MGPSRLPVDRRWGIVSVTVLFQIASLGVTLNSFTFFVETWSKEFHAPISELTATFTVMNFVLLFILPSVGRFCDRFSVRGLVAIGVLCTAAMHVAVGMVTGAWQLIALYAVLLPICVSLNGTIPAQTLVARWFDKGRGFAMGLSAFGVQLAGVIFPPIVVAMLPLVGWRGTWWIFAGAITLVVLPICWGVIRDWPKAEVLADGAVETRPQAPPLSARQILSHRNIWIVAGTFLAVQIPLQAVSINLAPLLTSRHVGGQAAAGIAALSSVCAIAAKLAAGYVSDRLGNRLPLVVSAAAVAVGLLVLAYAADFTTLAVGYALIGASGAQWTLLASTTGAEFAPSTFGRAFGILSTFTPLCAIGPVALATLQEHTGTYGPGILILAALSAVGAVVALLYRQPRSPAV